MEAKRNFLSDWKFWIFIMQAMTFIFGSFAFLVIKFNDLKHSESAISALDKRVDILTELVIKVDTRLSIIEAIYKERK